MPSKLFMNRVDVKVRGSSIFVNISSSGTLIRFLGASCSASLEPGNDWINSVTFFPVAGKPAIVALAVWNREKDPHGWVYAYFLEITWKGDSPWIDLDKAWIPPNDHIGQALERGVTVQINGVTYSSYYADEKRQSATLRFVPDGNLLCRYLSGDAKAEEVAAAAQAFEEEKAWPAKYAAIEVQLQAAQTECAKLNKLLGTANEDRSNFLNDSLERMRVLFEIQHIAQNARFGSRGMTLKEIIKQSRKFSEPPVN